MLSLKEQHLVKQYLVETEQVPEMRYIVNKYFLENVYNSIAFKFWQLRKSFDDLKQELKKVINNALKNTPWRIK